MDPLTLIPTPDTIPAPSWLFLLLDVSTFTLHILLINIVLGGSLILLFTRAGKQSAEPENKLQEGIAGKLPVIIALAINFGVAPLLFLQVIYGHLFYTSSVLMAVYWILIIPLLIVGYYGAYYYIRKKSSAPMLSRIAILLTSLILLYIGFIFVNNMTMMAQPEKWVAYFENRGGTLLNSGDPTIIPRYLHFVTASIAIGGLFLAIVWWFRKQKNAAGAEEKIKSALRIFGIATAMQVVIGFWFLLALPSEFIIQFMGQNLFFTLLLFAGIFLGIGAIVFAFLGNLTFTAAFFVATILTMVITRANLRALYLGDAFSLSSLKVAPQYGVMALFFIIFAVGIVSVVYMVRMAISANERRIAS